MPGYVKKAMDNVYLASIQFGMHLNGWESTYVARDALSCASTISYYLRALPTVRVHLELDGRTLDIVHSLNKRVKGRTSGRSIPISNLKPPHIKFVWYPPTPGQQQTVTGRIDNQWLLNSMQRRRAQSSHLSVKSFLIFVISLLQGIQSSPLLKKNFSHLQQIVNYLHVHGLYICGHKLFYGYFEGVRTINKLIGKIECKSRFPR